MQSSFVIAQILGPAYLIVGIGLLLNTRACQRNFDEILEGPAFEYLVGLLALSFGLVILAMHHSWNADWTFVVTLIGWLALIKGCLLIQFPSVVLRLSRPLMAEPIRLRAWATIPLTLGLFLGVKGFGLA